MKELAQKSMSINGVVVMKGKDLIPNPYKFPEKTKPEKPLLSKDGSTMIYEKSLSAGKYFLYSPDGNHRLVGEGGSVNASAISPDGELLGIIAVSLTMDTFTVRDGKRKQIYYVPYAKKKIVNWEEAYKGSESLYKMIPETPSRILNK